MPRRVSLLLCFNDFSRAVPIRGAAPCQPNFPTLSSLPIPWYLLLLPLVFAFFVWCNRHTVTDMSPTRRMGALVLRCGLAILLILILAGFKIVKPGNSLAVVFVVDSSKSVRDDQRTRMEQYIQEAGRGMHTVDKIGVITFASEAHLQSPLGQPLDATSPARSRRDDGYRHRTRFAAGQE